MSSTHQRLRTLGYLLDRHDQWVLPRLGLRLEDPELLLSVPESELEAFHDPETWLQLPGEPAPSLDPELSRTLRSLELRWDPHLAAYDNGSGAWLREDQVRSLGSAGLTELVERGRAWERKHLRRKQVGCLGLVLMVLWLIAGWIAGLEAWLGGMMLIAGVALAMRPRSAPEGLWDPADTELLAHALDASESALPPEWAELISPLGAIPAGPDALYLLSIERGVRIDALQERFSPQGLSAILDCLSAIDPEME